MSLDHEILHAVLVELEETKDQNKDLRRMNHVHELDVHVLREALNATKNESRFARDHADEIIATNLREIEALQQQNRYLIRRCQEPKRSDDEQENDFRILSNALRNRGDDARRATERANRLAVENEGLRQRKSLTPEQYELVNEMIVTLQRTTTLLLRNQGVDSFTDVPGAKSWDDVRHMLEAMKHALNDSGVPGA